MLGTVLAGLIAAAVPMAWVIPLLRRGGARNSALRKEAWRFLIGSAFTSVVVNLLLLIGLTQASFSAFPWAVPTRQPEPWMPSLLPLWCVVVVAGAALSTVVVWTEWNRLRSGRLPAQTITLGVLASCLAVTLTAFGQANTTALAERSAQSYVYVFVSPGVEGLWIGATVDSDRDLARLTGTVALSIGVKAQPRTEVEFMVVGNGYFAASEFSASTPSVTRRDQGLFVSGTQAGASCVPKPRADAVAWPMGGRWSPIRGRLMTSSIGYAESVLTFHDEHEWFTEFGGRTSVRLPTVYVGRALNAPCVSGLGGYAGEWAPPKEVNGYIQPLASDVDVRIIRAPESEGEQANSRDLTAADLFWRDPVDVADTDLNLKASYEAESPSTAARAQALAFFAALAGGLALAALLQLLAGWQPPPSVSVWARTVSARKPSARVGRIRVTRPRAVRRRQPATPRRRWRRKGF